MVYTNRGMRAPYMKDLEEMYKNNRITGKIKVELCSRRDNDLVKCNQFFFKVKSEIIKGWHGLDIISDIDNEYKVIKELNVTDDKGEMLRISLLNRGSGSKGLRNICNGIINGDKIEWKIR
jgi:hypothetical protein